MAVVKLKNPDTGEEKTIYIDNKLKFQLDTKVKSALSQKDEDYVIVIDGSERGGKSTFGQQLGAYIDPTLIGDSSRICFTPDEFRKAILNAKKKQSIVYDEAYRGLSSRGALTEINKILVSLMMEMGQRNLFIIIILPTFYLLEKYVAIWRARGLFHTYRDRKGRKGRWIYFNSKKKKRLYLIGKKDYGYNYVKSSFKGRFLKGYIIEEAAYRKKKEAALNKGYKTTKQEKYMEQRNILIYALSRETGANIEEIVKLMKFYGVPLKKTIIGEILKKFRKD